MSTDAPTGYPADGARIGRFRIVGKLGQGGMGVVYRAVEENLGREVALKIIAPHVAHDPEFRNRFTREARAQASLESSHVVAVYAHGEEDGYLYIASQLIADGDLGRMIKQAGSPPVVDALDILEQVASGLSDAHEAGLVHRDIKPGNVLIRIRSGSLRAYLADFGIARKIDADNTRAGQVAGTPSYMAPELHRGARASAATDVYALGCLLWVTLTVTPPYAGATEYEVIQGHMSAPIPQLKGDGAMVQATNRVLRMAMAKDPAHRYPSAAAMRADLQAALRLPPSGQALFDSLDPQQTAVRPTTPSHPPAAWSGGPSPTPGAPLAATPPPATPPPGTPPPGAASSYPAGPSGIRPFAQPPRRRTGRTLLIVGTAAAAVLAIALGGGVAYVLNRGDGPNPKPGPDPNAEASARQQALEEFADQDAHDILDAGYQTMREVDSMVIEARFQSDKYDRLKVDVALTADGDCTGTLDYGDAKGTVEMIRLDDRAVVKPDEEFWRATSDKPQVVIDEIDGRWVESPGMSDIVDTFCDLTEFVEILEPDEDTEYTNRGLSKVDGFDIVTITEGDNQDSDIHVKADEKHYVTRLQSEEKGYFEFRDFDAEVEIDFPAEKDIYDMS